MQKERYFNNDSNTTLGGFYASPIPVVVPAHYEGTEACGRYRKLLNKVDCRLSFLQNRITKMTANCFECHEAKILLEQRTHIRERMEVGLPFVEFVHKNSTCDFLVLAGLQLKMVATQSAAA